MLRRAAYTTETDLTHHIVTITSNDTRNTSSNSHRLFIAIGTIICGLLSVIQTFALPATHYAQTSVLAEGKWIRVTAPQSGMTFISNSTLRSMGFSDPSKVNVYGYGGQEIPGEITTSSYIDDLPLQPCVRTTEGLVFYASDINTWQWDPSKNITTAGIDRNFSHSVNRYSDKSYYFLSDRLCDGPQQLTRPLIRISNAVDTISFCDRTVYEQELVAPSNTGAIMLGEDFRSNNSRTFSFNLTDKMSDAVSIFVSFGLNATGGTSSLEFRVNNDKLQSSSSDNISALTNSEQFIRMSTIHKSVRTDSEKLDLNITLRTNAAVKIARLDFIEIEWLRRLRLDNGILQFHMMPDKPVRTVIEGCSEKTVIWDITDPARPVKVEYELNGTSASFYVNKGVYRDFIAFNPESVRQTVSGSVDITSQNIHASETPDMLIISTGEFLAAAERVAALHREKDNMKVAILDPTTIYNEFSSGNPDPGAFRKLLKMWTDRAVAVGDKPVSYCLLMGRPTFDNKGKSEQSLTAQTNNIPIWQSLTGTSHNTSYSTDDYVGMTDDCESFTIGREKIRVAVGRWPVKDAKEASRMADKLEKYVKTPVYGAWRNNIMLIADDQDNAIHLDQAENVYNAMRKNGNGSRFFYERLYLDSYPLSYSGTGACYPEAKERMMQKFNESVYINYIGHANTKSWTHEGLLNWIDINSFSNKNLPFLYAATCEFNRWDSDAVSGAEVMWLNPTSGVIGMICPSRTVYISQNGTLNTMTHSSMLTRGADGKAKRVGDYYIEGKNAYPSSDDNKLRYTLMSDPALRLVSPLYRVTIDRLGENDMTEGSQTIPELKARQRVVAAGRIVDDEGNVVNDFNGVLELSLYDAEKVIETYGNGDEGRKRIYNDHKTRLYNSCVTVKDGKWETTILMPVEIDNSYNPALISLYAYDQEKGEEANGSSTRLYVYGYDASADNDTEGPKILSFVINSESFRSGDVVNMNPVAIASLSDPSGINISDSGIGHKLTLTLDGNKTFEDINSYYRPDEEDNTKGSFAYPISGLEPGTHSLRLTAWDNANNSSTAEILFNVGVGLQPVITSLATDASPATTDVTFTVATDQPMTRLKCRFEVITLDGRVVWSEDLDENTDIGSTLTAKWNLLDKSGHRVPRGIYLYRATIETPQGTSTSKTNKMAVAAA